MSGMHAETATVRPGYPKNENVDPKADASLPPKGRPAQTFARGTAAGLAAIGVIAAILVIALMVF